MLVLGLEAQYLHFLGTTVWPRELALWVGVRRTRKVCLRCVCVEEAASCSVWGAWAALSGWRHLAKAPPGEATPRVAALPGLARPFTLGREVSPNVHEWAREVVELFV